MPHWAAHSKRHLLSPFVSWASTIISLEPEIPVVTSTFSSHRLLLSCLEAELIVLLFPPKFSRTRPATTPPHTFAKQLFKISLLHLLQLNFFAETGEAGNTPFFHLKSALRLSCNISLLVISAQTSEEKKQHWQFEQWMNEGLTEASKKWWKLKHGDRRTEASLCIHGRHGLGSR